jgi:gas vesicle protein
MSDNKNNRGLQLILGFAAGAIAGWWLNTDQGKAFRKNSADTVNQWGQNVGDVVTTQASHLQEGLKQTLANGQEMVAHAGQVIKERIQGASEEATEVVETAEADFAKGMKKAQQHLNN